MNPFITVFDGSVTSPRGFTAGVASAGLRANGAPEVTLIVSETPSSGAGLFTRNRIVAAPVIISRQTLSENRTNLRGVVINAKNANACTGEPGLEAARQMQQLAAEGVDCDPTQILIMSTGVIGVQLPIAKIGRAITAASQEMGAFGLLAADAIMTTDTRPKSAAIRCEIDGQWVTIGGMAKGAGMIHPNMATMLSLITTDAAISADLLQTYLETAVNLSFNRISIDGDTSTNDTILMLANGMAEVTISAENSAPFCLALIELCTQLAQMIVRDGEGATRFVEIEVVGSADNASAHQIANTIATSPLVKTAFAGGDANWGRILAAAGRSGVDFSADATQLWFSDDGQTWLQVLANGTPTAYPETEATRIFAQPDIWVRLSVGSADGQATVWTCDLTHEYVSINGDYRT